MGKRKFDSDAKGAVKKSRSDSKSENTEKHEAASEQPQTDEGSGSKPTSTVTQQSNSFDVKYFRKELSGKNGQTMALTQFLQVCLNPDNEVDYMLEFLKIGGNSHEILRQISQDNKKNLTLATPAFHLFHLIILKVQSSLPHMISITEEACRYFLNTFMPTVEIMISENAGPRHRKIVFNLLTSMVTLNSDLGVEILNQVPLTPKNLHYVVERPNYKEKDNVRTAFVHFMTSFLVDGHLPLIKALLDKQGLLSLVIPGLIHDDVGAVLMFLNTLKKSVVDNALISKTLKLKTFSHHVLHNMFKIFTWKGPPELNNEQNGESREEIAVLLSDILLTLFTSHKLGLYFVDSLLGTSDANKNQNLYKALQALKRPWENKYQCEVVLEIIYKCPDLHRAIISVIEQSFIPQHNPSWERTANFFLMLLDRLKPENMMTKLTILNPVQTANFVRFVTLPVPLLKLINTGIGKDHTLSLYCIRILVKMLQTLKRYMQIIELEEMPAKISELKNKLDHFLPKHMPAHNTIVLLMNNVINNTEKTETTQDYRLQKFTDADSMLALIDLLLLYNYAYPPFFESLEGTIYMRKVLDFSLTITTGHISLLKFKIVSLWLLLDTTVLTVDNPLFKNLFVMMLEVYTNEKDDTWIEAKDILQIFLKSTEIFEGDEDEIHLILYALRNSKLHSIPLISDIVEYVLENREELSEYVKNQVLNFENSDELSKTNLDRLFSDLMHNRNTEGKTFVETKIPSLFIIGCTQFIQTNREAKKNLKPFLNLYVANLLHCNYSPELTELLVGDCKLDVTSYVADWTVQSVVIPESTTKDASLQNISKSIIGDEHVLITDIFPLIESPDEIIFKEEDVTYTIDISKTINNSDLYVWAKYLMFCVVSLTKLGLLSHEQQKKTLSYFKIIIGLGKKHHMLDICRDIILNLFNNVQFLKIYKPMDLHKNPSNRLATEFLLQMIEENKDILNHINKRNSVLRSYQQKTFSEIAKAFNKIYKRKDVNSDLIIRALNVVGMTAENDLQVMNNILYANIETCYKDDKEPSFVLDLLRILVEKYSNIISMDIPCEILKKCMDLYFSLLNLKEITTNLTNLEQSLIKYFENKPHKVVHVNEEDFKKFFYANTVRKSTAQLALILMKYNNKLCNTFKEELNRDEILSQRELTLPLGTGVVDRNRFLFENKRTLQMIYKEYQSNIKKFLEKPHKAGQVYVNSSKFLRKIIIECMDIQECQKIFHKSHKFELLEPNHLELIHVVFYKIFLSEDPISKSYLINYFLTILNVTVMAVKENKIGNIIDVLSTNITNVIQIVKNFDDLLLKDTAVFKKITESNIWQHFCKSVLKTTLKIKTVGNENIMETKLLSLLTSMVKLFYQNDHEDIVNLFDMVTSHSEFLNVMLSHHSPEIKLRLLEFLFVLISTNRAVMKTQQIPVYLSAYRATRTPSDRLLLSILQFYEANDLPVNEYKPYIWGDSAANHYAVRKTRTSTLWAHPTPNQVMNLFDKDLIEKTVNSFPVNQKLDYIYTGFDGPCVKNFMEKILHDGKIRNGRKDVEEMIDNLLSIDESVQILAEVKEKEVAHRSHIEDDDNIYDPAFLLPLLSHLLGPGSVASSFKLLRSGLLSVPVMALSSHCSIMRAAAYHVLHRFHMLLETETRHKNDKLLLMDFITTLRQSLSTAIDSPSTEGELKDVKNPKLPAIGALYLARALMVSTSPSEPLYKPVNNFLIAKQFVDLTVVPDFLSLFHDSDVETVERRHWVLDIIKDGTKTMTDVNVVFKTMCLKMIMDFFNTTIADRKTKLKILYALNSVIAIPRAFDILVQGYGLMSWLHFVVRNMGKEDKAVVKAIFNFIENMVYSMDLNLFSRHCSKFSERRLDGFRDFKVKTDLEYEILSVIYDLLVHTELLDLDDVVTYMKLYNKITKRSIKFLSKKQVLQVVNRCCWQFKHLHRVRLIQQAVVLNNPLMLCSKALVKDVVTIEDKLVEELKSIVHSYVG